MEKPPMASFRWAVVAGASRIRNSAPAATPRVLLPTLLPPGRPDLWLAGGACAPAARIGERGCAGAGRLLRASTTARRKAYNTEELSMRLGSPVALLLSMLRMLGESCNSSGTVEQQKQLLWLVQGCWSR